MLVRLQCKRKRAKASERAGGRKKQTPSSCWPTPSLPGATISLASKCCERASQRARLCHLWPAFCRPVSAQVVPLVPQALGHEFGHAARAAAAAAAAATRVAWIALEKGKNNATSAPPPSVTTSFRFLARPACLPYRRSLRRLGGYFRTLAHQPAPIALLLCNSVAAAAAACRRLHLRRKTLARWPNKDTRAHWRGDKLQAARRRIIQDDGR